MLNKYDFHTLRSIIWGKSLTDEAQSSYFLPFSSGFSKSRSDKYCFKPGFPPKMSTLIGIFWFLYPVDQRHLGSVSLCLHMLAIISFDWLRQHVPLLLLTMTWCHRAGKFFTNGCDLPSEKTPLHLTPTPLILSVCCTFIHTIHQIFY